MLKGSHINYHRSWKILFCYDENKILANLYINMLGVYIYDLEKKLFSKIFSFPDKENYLLVQAVTPEKE